ncbi:MAG: NUDIX domain-containing protein [Bacteriovoracia bacterium]
MANSFETAERMLIPAVLVYLRASDHILMLHRNTKKNDYHEGKYNGLGGKCEPNESIFDAAIREVKEESGIIISRDSLRLVGHVHFPGFKKNKTKQHVLEDWLVAVFIARLDTRMDFLEKRKGPEGELIWVPQEKVLNLNLWAGDKVFLPKVFSGTSFYATIWYDGELVVKFELD